MEIHYVSLLGLVLIAISWMIQFSKMSEEKTLQGGSKVSRAFVGVNCFGILLLAFDSFSTGALDIALGNVLALTAALLVLSRTRE